MYATCGCQLPGPCKEGRLQLPAQSFAAKSLTTNTEAIETKNMASKRKRNRPGHSKDPATKRQKIGGDIRGTDCAVKEAVLAPYYAKVLSLREYLVSKLPETSKIRRKKILHVGQDCKGKCQGDKYLGQFLDRTLVGLSRFDVVSQEERIQRWNTFSQRADTSVSTLTILNGPSIFSQSEVRVHVF